MTATGPRGDGAGTYHYVGMLRSYASWAKVARELLGALVRQGRPVSWTGLREDRYCPDFPLSRSLAELPPPRGEGADVVWTFSHPDRYGALPRGRRRVGMMVYEGTCWPDRWLRSARRHLDRVVVPSSFCRDALVGSGYPASRVGVVPHGVDPAVYRAVGGAGTRRDASAFHVLFLGTPARRKGLDVLLRAFARAFRPGDPATLTLKLTTYPDASERPYLLEDWEDQVGSLRGAGHEVRVHRGRATERELAGLYRGADLLCHPHRGEGFGLPLLEAMACGTPVLTTAFGGPLDFLDEDVGMLVEPAGMREDDGRFLIGGGEAGAEVAEPDADAVTAKLRCAFQRPERLRELSAASAERAGRWTWTRAARRLVAELGSPGSETPARREGRPWHGAR